MEKIALFDDLLERVRAKAASESTKQASASAQGVAMPTETDPNDKGTVSKPGDEALDGKKEKQTVGESKENKDNGEAGKTLENAEAETVGSGEGKTMEGEDPANLPTGDDLFKKKAADIVSSLKSRFGLKVDESKKEASEKKEEKKEESKKEASEKKEEPKKEESKKEASEKEESKKEASKKEESKKEEKKEASEKSEPDGVASDFDQEFTHDFHVKLASQLLSTEEGRDHVRSILGDAIGAEAVDKLVKQASIMETQMQKQAAFEAQINELMSEMSEEERQDFIKSANYHQSEVSKLEHDFEKKAYEQGAMDAAMMAGSGGELPPIPEEGEAPSIEELVMILDQLVQSGQIDPAMAEAILAELMGAAEGGAPMDPAAAEGGAPVDPAAAVAAEEMPKAASTEIDALVDGILNEEAK